MVPPKLRRLISSVIRIMSRARCFSFFASDGKSFCSTRWHSTHLRPRLACIDCIAAMKRSPLTAPSSFTFLKMVPAGRFPVSPQSRPTGVSLPGIVMGLIRSARGTPASDENVPPSAGPPSGRFAGPAAFSDGTESGAGGGWGWPQATARRKPGPRVPRPTSSAPARFGSSNSLPIAFIPRSAARSRSVLGAISLTAEDFADRGEDPPRLLLRRHLPLGGDPAPLCLFLPCDLQRLGRIVRRQRQLARLAAGGLDGDVQQALLVEDEVHPLPGHLRRELERAEVFVVDDPVAVTLEDVQLEPLAIPRGRQTEAVLRGDLRVLLDHLSKTAAGHGEPDGH